VAPTAGSPAIPTAQTVRAAWQRGEAIRVVVLGNSIGLGYYADGWEQIALTPERHLAQPTEATGHGVTAQLQRFLRARNPATVVANESGDGATTVTMSAWLDRVVAVTPRYDLALLPLQVNDANQGRAVSAFTLWTERMLDRLTAAGIVPVLVKENDLYDLPATRFGTPIADFMTAVDQIAAARGLAVIDGYTPFHAAVLAGGGPATCGLFWPHDDYAVGLHPNQAGHNLLFQAAAAWWTR
jgi:lysophospholipase L1-like esterase